MPPSSSPGITVRDIYYILFRHKWLILLLALLAVGTSVSIRHAWPVPYQSDAELLIKWVGTTHPVAQSRDTSDVQFVSMGNQEDNIINSEIIILTSQDVITQVVDVIGASRLLGHSTPDKSKALAEQMQAASFFKQHLKTAVARDTDIITLSFTHPSPQMPQLVLSTLIDKYKARHQEIHEPDQHEFLQRNIDDLDGKLRETQASLSLAKSNASISSLDGNIRANVDAIAGLEKEVRETEAALAEAGSIIKDRQALMAASGSPSSALPSTNAPAATNDARQIPPAVIAEYQHNSSLLANGRRTEERFLEQGFTEISDIVKGVHAEIVEKEGISKHLEEQYPGLLAVKTTINSSTPNGALTVDPRIALNEAIFRERAMAVRLQVLTNDLAHERARSHVISSAEGNIIELQRRQEIYQKQLAYTQQCLDQAQAIQAAGVSSISMVESPTMPLRDMTKVAKASMVALFAGLALALALPFLIELYLDQSLKRASEVQAKLPVPFFITLPKLKSNGKRRPLKQGKKPELLANGERGPAKDDPLSVQPLVAAPSDGQILPWDPEHALHPFFETLRDRLMTYFEMINLTHKPKLVAVTSCGPKAGVTTTAAGLASSLSETGEGNVLLVDMNVRDGEAHHFFKGKLACPLEEVFENGKRGDALGQGNLYVAQDAEGTDKLPRVMPKRFSHLVPKMRASDYDYIIFDMPPISQISITPRLARFMDMVLLVVESEKTDQEAAKQATKILTESKTNVGVVLNKSREYLPRRLQQDF